MRIKPIILLCAALLLSFGGVAQANNCKRTNLERGVPALNCVIPPGGSLLAFKAIGEAADLAKVTIVNKSPGRGDITMDYAVTLTTGAIPIAAGTAQMWSVKELRKITVENPEAKEARLQAFIVFSNEF